MAAPDEGPLADPIKVLSRQAPQSTGVYPLTTSQSALDVRLALINSAMVSVDLQYYIFRDDLTSKMIAKALLKAAERGVRVRLLLDDWQKRSDHNLLSLDSHPNVHVRLFNPVYNRAFRNLAILFNLDQQNRRMHNKSLTVDSLISIVGGRNIGDEYLLNNANVIFGDLDLTAIGPVVQQISQQFDLYWNAPLSADIAGLATRRSRHTETLQSWQAMLKQQLDSPVTALDSDTIRQLQQASAWYFGEAELFFDHPGKISRNAPTSQMLHQIGAVISKTQSSLLIISPYFIPSQSGTEALIKAATQGIDITIVTNSLASTDVFAVHGWYAHYRKALLKAGITLWEIRVNPIDKPKTRLSGSSRTSLHAKTFVIDNQEVFVGSFNFDPRSANLNSEMGIFIHQPTLASLVGENIGTILPALAYKVQLTDKGQLIWLDLANDRCLNSEPDASLLRRFGAWLSGILPIESIL
ncbi:phospholipase D family protein [Bowmanella pacifica]|uniref:Phospholipase D family protein n=2 Tax=Bowmanella pacifica TaxID=502051 RepID=A0A918DKD9_9ALTE|nr:phospholipase D family protein [Bowmanella pacifica]